MGISVQRYRIDYRIAGGLISFELLSNGNHHGSFEFHYVAYDEDNRVMIAQWTKIDHGYTAIEFDKISQGAYRFRQMLQIPTGAACLRLVVRDGIGDHIGSVEIPLRRFPESEAKAVGGQNRSAGASRDSSN